MASAMPARARDEAKEDKHSGTLTLTQMPLSPRSKETTLKLSLVLMTRPTGSAQRSRDDGASFIALLAKFSYVMALRRSRCLGIKSRLLGGMGQLAAQAVVVMKAQG